MIDRLGSISTSNWSRGLINNQQCLKRKTLWDPSSCNKKVKKPLNCLSLIWTCILVGFQWERNANMTCWSYFLQWNTPFGFSCLVQISKTKNWRTCRESKIIITYAVIHGSGQNWVDALWWLDHPRLIELGRFSTHVLNSVIYST